MAKNKSFSGARSAPGSATPKRQEKKAASAETRMAPDPMAVVLPAIAALAAVASIATIHWSAQDEIEDRAKPKRRVGAALRDLETCCIGLSEVFKRFQKIPRVFAGDGPSSTAALKFGTHTPRINADDARLYQKLVDDVASMLVLANQNAFDVMSAIEDGEIVAPEDLFYGFADCQEALNKVIVDRATLRASVEIGVETSQKLTEYVRELKKHLAV